MNSYSKRVKKSIEEQVENDKAFKKMFDWADVFSVIPIFLIVVIVLNGFFFSIASVKGPSMEPTYCNNDGVVIKYNSFTFLLMSL